MSANTTRRLAAAATGALAITLLTACGGSSSGSDAEDDAKVIGVAMKTQVQRRWTFDVEAMQAQAAENGDKLLVQYANDDPARQASQVEDMLSKGIDALIIVPVDSEAAATIVTEAKSQGVPVVSYDKAIAGADLDATIVRDSTEVGTMQAQAALDFAPDGGNFALIKGDPADDVARAISDAYATVLGAASDVSVVYDQFTKNWDPQAALSAAENVLSANDDDIAAFLTSNDGTATGAVQALDGRGMAGEVFVSGLDADPANLQLIAEGKQTMTVWTKIDEGGKIAADVAGDLARGQEVEGDTQVDNGAKEVPTMIVPIVAVTKDNMCEFITTIAPEGWVSEQEVYGKTGTC